MLNVRLLGQFSVHYRGVPIHVGTRTYQSLLAFLTQTAGTSHRRELLARQFWPDASKANAQSYLRHGLWAIKTALRESGADSDEYVLSDKFTITFNNRASYSLDVHELTHTSKRPDATTEALKKVANLYTGDLLPGFENEDNTDDWVQLHRTRLRRDFDGLMARLTQRLRDEACWQDLLQFGHHWAMYGNDVELAYREIMIGHGGLHDTTGVWAAYDKLTELLDKRFNTTPSDETEKLLKQLIDGTYPFKQTRQNRGDATTPVALAEPPHNLPQSTSQFVGREADVNEISAQLATPACNLITLMGPGGIGKTRLAIEVARQQLKRGAETFADGIFIARLESAQTTEAMIAAMADAVRLPALGQEQPRTQLMDFLRDKHMLLLLDNFEQLLGEPGDGSDSAGFIDDLLGAATGIKALVTSRERLHLEREHLIELDGLSYPASDDEGDVKRHGAVQLFLQTARRIYPRFDVDVELRNVAKICRLTQGMPLAIELAAAWVRTLTCKEIAMRIEKNLDVLASDQPNMPTRHRSVRAVLDYSWKLLSPTERNTFAALSVFRAGFNLDAAEEVAKAPLSQLFSLVDKSLLRRTPLGRYEMHELVRQYGEEKLDAVEDEDWRDTTVHARMARYFLQFAQDHAKDYPALEPEWGNFLAALRAAHERYEWPIVTELAQTLIDPWFTRARFTDAREGLALATTAASNDDDLTALANVLRWRGRACIEQAQYDEATSYLDHALQFADALDDASLIGVLEFSKGDVLTELGDYSNAELLLRNSIDRLRAIDDHKNVREASQLLARLYCDLQEFDKAAQIARDTLIATEGITHDRASLMLTWTLATAENERGNHEQARDLCEQCLSSCNLLQNQNEMVNTLYVYGQVLHRSKDFAEAHRKLAACLTLAKTLGRRKLSAHTTLYMSYVQRDSGQYDSAIACTNQSLDLYGTLKDSYSSVIAMRHLGDLYQSIGNIERACQVWHQAFSTARDTRHPLCASIEQRIAQFDKKSP